MSCDSHDYDKEVWVGPCTHWTKLDWSDGKRGEKIKLERKRERERK